MYAKRNQIFVGSRQNPTYYFENDRISNCNTSQAVALVGQELSIDVFDPVVSDNEENLHDIDRFLSSDGHEIRLGDGQIFCLGISEETNESGIINIPDETPVWYVHDGELVGKFYVSKVTRKARNKYQLNCVSAIGKLANKYHGGGLFQAQTFGDVLQHILAEGLHGTGAPVIEYEIDDDVADLTVSGWLPYSTKRENLYRLIFANGVNIVKNHDGNPRFTFVYTAPENAGGIDTSDIYNQGNVEYTKPYSKVIVMEHTYAAITGIDAVPLFDNTEGLQVTNEEIWFNSAPVIVSTLAAEGNLTIISATENSAVISGNGKLTGIPYTHSTRTVSRENVYATEEKTVSVEDCTMVNLVNSENLVNRLYAFYCPEDNIKKITNGIKHTSQRCGKAYTFLNPYGEKETAFLASMDITASSINKADCEWYAGYAPAGQQGLYQNVDIITPVWDEEEEEWILDGEWEVPEGVTEFKVVLISGGTGGGSGWPGENGEDARTYTEVAKTDDLSAVWYGAGGGAGGEGGEGGQPGSVKSFVIQNVTEGDSYTWSLGTGGDGGAATGFIPDTFDELKEALENEHPDTEYTTAQINAMLETEDGLTDWNGSPNAGSAGTATSFSDGTNTWSTADVDAYVPTGGVYEPITDRYFALTGNKGIPGGKGGARKTQQDGTFNWVTDGEGVVGDDGTVYRGGGTGRSLNAVSGLSEADILAYGGNGAGAAVGIGQGMTDPETGDLLYPHINGGSNQSTSWEVREEN